MGNGRRRADRPGRLQAPHRRPSGQHRLQAGLRGFRLDAERGKDFGIKLGVDEGRLYPDYKTLIAEEAKRKDGVEVVTIATPNFTHYEITKACLEAGLHVICEKPLFFTVNECQEIEGLAGKKGLIVGVTYGFTGHPLPFTRWPRWSRRALLGDIRMVDLQYTHGFNSGDDANARPRR